MDDARLLFIGGWNLLHGMNHRSRPIAAFLERRFPSLDSVGFENFRAGGDWARVSPRGAGRRIVVRDLPVPSPFNLLAKDLWRYLRLRPALAPSYDLAMFGHPENAWLAWLLKRSGRVRRLIYDDWDYYPGLEPNQVGARLMEGRERLCVRTADAVITVSEALANRRRAQGARRLLVVPNGVDVALFAPAREKLPHPPTLVYMGTLSPAWGVHLAIQAMPHVLECVPGTRLLVAGGGPQEEELQRLAGGLGVADQVYFLGRLEHGRLPAVLAQADVGLDPSLPEPFREHASPLKVMEYLAAGLPVISTGAGQARRTLEESGAGLLMEPSAEGLAEGAARLLEDRGLYERYSQKAVGYAARFDWELLLEEVHRLLLEVIRLEENGLPSAVGREGDPLRLQRGPR